MKTQRRYAKTLSFEFFPPKTAEGAEKLREARTQLAALDPAFFSVTFGAGGSTREGTFDTIREIHQAGLNGAPHISCIAGTRASVGELLDEYRALGIKRLVALRGDLPSGMVERGDFRYAADLVAFIRERTGDWFHIEVAAYPEMHPEAKSPRHDLLNFKRKAEAGANSAITQYFFAPEAYFRFVDECEAAGLDLPVVPGIMPITNFRQLARFSDTCGADIPRWLRLRLQQYEDDLDSLRDFGAEVVTHLCQTLLDAGAPGLHFYTLNKAEPTIAVHRRLRWPASAPSAGKQRV